MKKRDFRLGECRVGARCKDAGKGSLFCVVPAFSAQTVMLLERDPDR